MSEWEAFFGKTHENDKIAIIDGERDLTYYQLKSEIELLASNLVKLGVKQDSRVILLLPNSVEYIVSYFANNLLKSINVPIDYISKSSSIEDYIQTCNADFLITSSDKYSKLKSLANSVNCIVIDNFFHVKSFFYSSKGLQEPNFEKTSDVSLIMHTTGTTGEKKGIILTNKAVIEATRAINKVTNLPPSPIEIVSMPISRSFGLARIRCVLMNRGTIVLLKGLVNPALFIKTIIDYKVNGLALVPSGIRLLLSRFSEYLENLSEQINYIELGSSYFSSSEKSSLQKLMPYTDIYMHYGLTEASRTTFINFKDKDKLNSVGLPSPGAKIKICDDDMNTLNANQLGKILVKSKWLFKGYINSRNRDTFSNGWFHTDDIGKIDEDGYLYFISRNSDLINYQGYKFSPLDIEKLLNTHPLVASSCVVMSSSERSGIIAFIEKQGPKPPSLANIKKLCNDNLERYKVPAEIINVDRIERSDTGKIKRKEMVKKYVI